MKMAPVQRHNKIPIVLQVNSCLDKSTGRIAQQIGEKALSQGWRSVIAYPARAGRRDSQSELIEIGSLWDGRMHALLTRLFDRHGLGSKYATRKFIRQIDKLHPDIIHLHNIHGYYLHYPTLFRYLSHAGIPVVWTIHDCWPFTGHCVHFTAVGCEKWKNGPCHDCPQKNLYPASWLCDRSRRNYLDKNRYFTIVPNLTIVTVSHWLKGVAEQSFLKQYPIQVIQNGVDIGKFYPRVDMVESIRRKYGWQGKFVILGVATGWSEEVGFSTFVKLRSLLDDNYAIAMVGITPAQRSALPDGITAIGFTAGQDELAGIYTAADVLFNGSFQETFGLITAEALSCGTPVIVYNSTACPEIVTEETGRIIPTGDINYLLSAIDSIKNLPDDKKAAMQIACIDYARKNLDKEQKYQSYLDLYQTLLTNPPIPIK